MWYSFSAQLPNISVPHYPTSGFSSYRWFYLICCFFYACLQVNSDRGLLCVLVFLVSVFIVFLFFFACVRLLVE